MPGMRILLAVAVAVALAAGLTLLLLRTNEVPAAIPPPIAPPTSSPAGEPTIPEGFLTADAKSARPLTEEGLRWERAAGPHLPTLVSPCGGPLASDAERVAGRQVALTADNRWKLERLVVYQTEAGARAAMTERRSAVDTCSPHPEGDGIVTVWRREDLPIGDEAMFVAGQRQRGDQGLPGHLRGIIVRQGRTIVLFVDFGQGRQLADRSEVASYERDAATMATKLQAAPWN
jgi:hypothetical protein